MTELVESWDDWQSYPNFQEVTSFTEGHGLELIGYLVHNFAPTVCRANFINGRYEADLMESGIDCWLGIDDMVFIFLTLQHNINKWIRVYRILKDSVNVDGDSVDWKSILKNKEMKKTLEKVPGTEFQHGAGISGKDAQKRYLALTKYFNKLYFEMKRDENNQPTRVYTDQVEKNRDALVLLLKELVEKDSERNGNSDDAAPKLAKEPKKKRRKEPTEDDELKDIMFQQWQAIGMTPLPPPTIVLDGVGRMEGV